MPESALIGEALLAIELRKGALTRALDEELTAAGGLASRHGGIIGSALSKGFQLAKVGAEAVVGGLGFVGVASGKLAADFQRSMTMIHTQAGAVNEDLDKLGQALLQLAPEVGFSPDELAQSLYHVESAGFRSQAAINAVAAASKLAAIGGANLEDTTQAVIAAMAAWPKYAGDATSAAAILNAVVGTGDMRMEQLAKAMATGIGPAAANFGLSLTDVGAALATLTDNATPADEAATRLRMTFALLGAPTKQASETLTAVGLSAHDVQGALSNRSFLEQYGVSITSLASDLRKPNGLLVAVTDLKTHLENAGLSAEQQSAVISKAFGGGRTSAAIETLLTEFDRFKGKYAAINEGAGNFGSAWEQTKNTVSQQWKDLEASAEVLGVQIGSYLLGPMTAGLHLASDGLSRFGGIFQRDVVPAAEHFGDFLSGTLIPDAEHVGRYLADEFGPSAATLGHTFLDIAHVAKDDLLPPLISLARDAGPPIIDVITFITSHESILIGLLSAMAARFVLIKGLGMVEWGLGMANAFRVMAAEEGGMRALLSVLGLGGSQGISGALRSASTEAQAFRMDLTAVAAAETETAAATEAETVAITEQGAAAEITAVEGFGAMEKRASGLLVPMGSIRGTAAEATTAMEDLAPAAEGAATEVEGMGGSFAALGGPVAVGVAVVAGAALAIGTDTGGIRTDLKNAFFGKDLQAQIAAQQRDFDEQLRTQFDQMAQDVVQGTHKVQDEYVKAGQGVQQFYDMVSKGPGHFGMSDEEVAHVKDLANALGGLPAALETGKYSLDDFHKHFDVAMGHEGAEKIIREFGDTFIATVTNAAKTGEMSYAAALKKMADNHTLNDLAERDRELFAELTDAHSAMVDAMNEQNRQQTDQAIRDGQSMYETLQYMGQQEAQQAVADGKIKSSDVDRFTKDYVAKNMAAWKQVNPQYQQALDLIHQQAQALGISDKLVIQYGQDTVQKMLDVKQKAADTNSEFQKSHSHLIDINRDTSGIAVNAKTIRDTVNSWDTQLQASLTTSQDLANAWAKIMSSAQGAANAAAGLSAPSGGLYHHAAGGKFYSPHMAVIGDNPQGPEWVINSQQAGPLSGLLDYLVGAGGGMPSRGSSIGGGGDGGAILAELRASRMENQELRAELRSLAAARGVNQSFTLNGPRAQSDLISQLSLHVRRI